MNYRWAFMMFISIGCIHSGRSQSYSREKEIAADTIFRDKYKLSTELSQLRDSINHELESIALRADTPLARQPNAERAKKRLKTEKVKVDEAIENVVHATRDTWNYYIRETANNTLFQSSYEYHRIKKQLLESSANRHP